MRQLQEALYRAAPDMLAKALQASTFHMTLHDLANGKPDQPGLPDSMRCTQEQVSRILPNWKDTPPLQMKTTWLFNMVNTGIVLGLAPADAGSWRRLDEMYMALESVVKLGYALTPHITVGYFRPPEQARRLSAVLRPVDLDITLRMEDLVLQYFSDMNHYEKHNTTRSNECGLRSGSCRLYQSFPKNRHILTQYFFCVTLYFNAKCVKIVLEAYVNE